MAHFIDSHHPRRPDNRRFGDMLRAARRHRGLSQEGLGLRVDMCQAEVSSVETGTRSATMKTMPLLARALGMELRITMHDPVTGETFEAVF